MIQKQLLILNYQKPDDVYDHVKPDKRWPQVEVFLSVCSGQVEWRGECGSSRAVRLAGNKFDKSKPKTQQEKEKLFVPAAAENTREQ